MRTTQRKGDIATTQAIASFTKFGFDVAVPVTESASYDLLVEKSAKIYKVQVKYSSETDIDLRNIHSNSKGYVVKKTKKYAYDWLYVLKDTDQEYLFKECFENRRSVRPSKKDLIINVLQK